MLLERSEMLRSLRHYLRAQSQGHHTIDRLEERGVERGSARRSSLKGRERAIVNQTNYSGTVSKATLGQLLRDGVERNGLFRAHRYHLELKRTYLVILQHVQSGLVHELTRTENKLLRSCFATCKRQFLTNRTRKGAKNRCAHVCECVCVCAGVCVCVGVGASSVRFPFKSPP